MKGLFMKIVALAGGVGGAKMADGMAQALPAEDLTVIVNTGDDFDYLGLKICPDLDTVCYTLAGLANPSTGWGQIHETWNAIQNLEKLGGPTWFSLGDRDLGTHLARTYHLREGKTLSQITRDFCRSWGVKPRVLPMSDDPTPTIVLTSKGELPFQEYFVHQQCAPEVIGFRFEGIEKARPAPGVLEAMESAALIVICPSNPWVSIDPILAIPGVRDNLCNRPVVAVSPIIGGKTVKGPAAKMFAELNIQPSAVAVARHYGAQTAGGLLTGFVMDTVDAASAAQVLEMGIPPLVTQTLMQSQADRLRLAKETLAFWKTR
jgi:LPPG:FO 2-phospho-L-lactate transferase